MIAAANLGDLLDTAAMLASQPVPAGYRVGVVSTTCGAGVLAGDACGEAGMEVATLARHTQGRCGTCFRPRCHGGRAGCHHERDHSRRFRRCLELAGADPGVDAVLALTTATAAVDLVPEVCAAGLECRLPRWCWTRSRRSGCCPAPASAPRPSRPMPGPPAPLEPSATRHATAPGARTPPGRVPDLEGLRQDLAEKLIDGFLAAALAGGWLAQRDDRGTARLLRHTAGRRRSGDHRGCGGRRGIDRRAAR